MSIIYFVARVNHIAQKNCFAHKINTDADASVFFVL